MTDVEEIEAYISAWGYRDTILKEKIPKFIQRDPEALAIINEHRQKEIIYAEAVMQKAEQAIERLPCEKWRKVMACRYFHNMTAYQAATAIYYSEKTAYRLIWAALEYLKETEKQNRQKRPPEGP